MAASPSGRPDDPSSASRTAAIATPVLSWRALQPRRACSVGAIRRPPPALRDVDDDDRRGQRDRQPDQGRGDRRKPGGEQDDRGDRRRRDGLDRRRGDQPALLGPDPEEVDLDPDLEQEEDDPEVGEELELLAVGDEPGVNGETTIPRAR